MIERPAIAIIGAGNVASTLARAWGEAGCDIVALHNRSAQKGQALAQSLGLPYAESPEEAALSGDLIFLMVADAAIEALVAQLAAAGIDWSGRSVVHCAGAYSVEILAPLAEQGAELGSFHPALPFADPAVARAQLAGASIAIEASAERTAAWLRELAALMRARVIMLPAGSKARYHAALVLLSNYMVTLFAAAQSILLGLGADQDAADATLLHLLEGGLANLRTKGIPAALTGPLARADVKTLSAHLDALRDDSLLRQVYRDLALLTRPLLIQRGMQVAELDAIYALIQQESLYESLDDTGYSEDEGQQGAHRAPDGL